MKIAKVKLKCGDCAANGRYRSGAIKLLAHHGHIRLNRAWLQRQIKLTKVK